MPPPTTTTSTSVRLAAQPPGVRDGGLSVPCGSSATGGAANLGHETQPQGVLARQMGMARWLIGHACVRDATMARTLAKELPGGSGAGKQGC